MGCAGDRLPAVVPVVGPVRHARDDGARSARAPKRPRAGRRRSAVVAGVDLRRKEIARRLRYIPLSTSFRSAYAYDNVLYLVAGEVIEAVSGQTWEDFVSSRILAQGRHDAAATSRHSDAAGRQRRDAARRVEGKVRPIAPFDSDNTNPAGGINSNADDMAKWLIVQLGRGRLADGTRLFSAGDGARADDAGDADSYRRRPAGAAPCVRASAATASASVARLSRPQAGDAHRRPARLRLESGDGARAASSASRYSRTRNPAPRSSRSPIAILDRYLGAPAADWIAAYRKVEHARAARGRRRDERDAARRANAGVAPSLPLARYAGTYRDAWYGDMTIASAAPALMPSRIRRR